VKVDSFLALLVCPCWPG